MKNISLSNFLLNVVIFCCLNTLVLISANSFGREERECNIVERFKSPYVTAFVSVPVVPVGCISQEVTSDGQQVHVIKLQQFHNDSNHHFRTVNLLIKPAINLDPTTHVDVIYVLSSDNPVVWRVQAERFKNISLSIWVSSNSQVTVDRHIRVDIKKVELSLSPLELVTWSRNKWSALSVMTTLQSANSITSTVGTDITASDVCRYPSSLSNFPAYNVRRQNSGGCVAVSDNVNRIVHVIELISAGDQVSNVAVNINVRSKATYISHLVLVLKSHQPVKWHIAAHRLRCMLDIITDQTVNSSGVNIEPFRVVAEGLHSYSGRDLVVWTSEKYGQPVSYTRTLLANQFDVTVDGLVQSESRRHFHHLRQVISTSMSVNCLEDSTQVALSKQIMEGFGLSRYNFTLSSFSCYATENATHILLSTGNDECGTSISPSGNDHASFIRTNAIAVHGVTEDARRHTELGPLMINFSCIHPLALASSQKSSSHSSFVHGRIKLYRDEQFLNEIAQIPAVVHENELLFVEVGINANVPLGVLSAKCVLESGHSTLHEKRKIIEGNVWLRLSTVLRCQTDDSVNWLNGKQDIIRGLRFRLDLSQHWSGKNSLMIQCKLALCSVSSAETGTSEGLKQCVKLDNYCKGTNSSQNLAALSDFIINASTGISLQPLVDSKDTQWNTWSKSCEAENTTVVQGISSEVVIIIAFAAFAIGVLLMSSLWFIHTRTGHLVEHKRRVLRSAETSGESTPSSTVGRHISTR